MARLSVIEMTALIFTGVAALAGAVQAYATWETRGEVARAIVYAERIEACAELLTALDPVTAKATAAWRDRIAAGAGRGQHQRLLYYFPNVQGMTRQNPDVRALLDRWRRAASAYRIVMPQAALARLDYFEGVMRDDILSYEGMTRADFIAWLERVDREAASLRAECRALVPSGRRRLFADAFLTEGRDE